MSDILYWLADNLPLWRPIAILALLTLVVVCLDVWLAVWE